MTKRPNTIVTPAMAAQWRADREQGIPLRQIAERDGVAVATVQRYTAGVDVPYRPVEDHRRPHPVNRRRRRGRIAIAPSETAYPDVAEGERPASRLRQKLAEIRERAA